MLNLLNVWLLVAMTNFSSPVIQPSNLPGPKQVTTTTITDKLTLTDCTAADIKNILANFFYVTPESIELSSDMLSYTMYHPKGIQIDGWLFYFDCGTDCTTMVTKTSVGMFGIFELPCDMP